MSLPWIMQYVVSWQSDLMKSCDKQEAVNRGSGHARWCTQGYGPRTSSRESKGSGLHSMLIRLRQRQTVTKPFQIWGELISAVFLLLSQNYLQITSNYYILTGFFSEFLMVGTYKRVFDPNLFLNITWIAHIRRKLWITLSDRFQKRDQSIDD